jgi:hypothetical protein
MGEMPDPLREKLEALAEKCHQLAGEHLDFGMETIRRFEAANDLTDIRFALRDLLASEPARETSRRLTGVSYAVLPGTGTGVSVPVAGSGGEGSRAAPAWGTPEWHRLHPIFETDFSKPPHALIEKIRTVLSQLRGSLSDIGHGYTGWREQLECAEGLLTCGISFLHGVMLEMEKIAPRSQAVQPEATPSSSPAPTDPRQRKADASLEALAVPSVPVGLFQPGAYSLHSGGQSPYKIECDALTDSDWAGLAVIAVERLPAFGSVEGVPRGGLPFAKALAPHATSGPLLIAEDVTTTGASLEVHRAGRNAIGVVAFARSGCPAWVTPIWSLAALGPTVPVGEVVSAALSHHPPSADPRCPAGALSKEPKP